MMKWIEAGSVSQNFIEKQSKKAISSADLNKDHNVDMIDLVKAKKITNNSPSSSTVGRMNEKATQNIKNYMLSSKYDYDSAIRNGIEKANSDALSKLDGDNLIKLLESAKSDSRLSDDEKQYYDSYRNQFSNLLESKQKRDYANSDYEYEAKRKGRDRSKEFIENILLGPSGLKYYKQEAEKADKEYQKNKNSLYYSSLPSGEYKENGDKDYYYINHKDETGNIEISSKRIEGKKKYLKYDMLTEKEVGIYNYLYQTKGKSAAENYLKFLDEDLENRRHSKFMTGVSEYAKERPVISAGVSVLTNVASGAEAAQNAAKYILTGEMKRSEMADVTSILRSELPKQVDWEIKNWDAFDFIYNTGMSGIDTVVAAPLGAGAMVSMGLTVAANTTNDILDRGGDNSQAFWGGVTAGIFEAFFEKFSIGELNAMKEGTVAGFKDLAKNIGKSMLVNASEETATEIANILYDYAANDGISQYAQLVSDFMANGDNEAAAKKKAAKQLGLQVLEAGASGALMGFGFGALGSAYGYHNASSVGKAIAANNAEAQIVDLALNLDNNTTAYKMASEVVPSGNISTAKIGAIAIDIMNEVNTQKADIVRTAVNNRATELSASSEVAGKISDYFAKFITGDDISIKERTGIKNNYIAKQIATEINSEEKSAWLNDMNDKLSTVEQLQNKVVEATTVSNAAETQTEASENSELQSNANGGIIDNGGDRNVISDQGTVSQNSEGFPNRQQTAGADSQNGRTRQENQSDFIRRTQGGKAENGRGKRVLLRHGKSVLSYTEKASDNAKGDIAVKMLKSAGVDAVYCDGVIETNQNGVTVIHSEALTTPDGRVLISSNTALSAEQIAYHENVHVNDNLGTEAYSEYESVICGNLLYNSKTFEDICTQINDNHYGGKYDVESPENAKMLIQEITAYVNEFVMTDPEFAKRTFGGMFENWGAVVEAVHKFNSDTGADFSESASFMPESREMFSEESKLSKSEAQDRLINIAKHLDKDMKVVFVSKDSVQLKGKKGKYVRRTNALFISKDASIAEQYIEVFKHEFVHRLESKSTYASFKNYLISKSSAFEKYVRTSLKLKNIEFDGTREGAIRALAEYYHKLYTENEGIAKYIRDSFTMEDAEREIVADFAGDILFKGKNGLKDTAVKLADEELVVTGDIESSFEALEELAKTDRNLLQKVIDAIRDLISSLMGRPQTQSITADLEYIENRLKRVYDSRDTKKAAKNSGEVKYSIAYDENGKYVNIDTDQNLFDNKSVKEMQIIARKLIKDRFKGKVLNVGKDANAYVNKRSSEEFAFPANRRIDANIKQSKMKSSPELDNLLYVSEFIEHQNDDGRHPEATGGWNVYSTRFKVGGQMFDGKIKIMITDNGNVFYDITKIERATRNSGQTESNSAAASGSPSIDSISKNETSVNTNSTQKTENYSEREDESSQFAVGSPMQQARENRIKYDNGEMTREEYLEENDRLWGEANEKYGSIPEGENAVNSISVPKQVSDDKNTRRFIRTVLESGKLDESMVTEVQDQLLNGKFSYEPISDEKAMKGANAAFESGTAEEEWNNAVNGGEIISKRKIAIGEKMLTAAAKAGDAVRVVELSAELADALTRAGQVVQAARMLKRMTGEGRLVSLQRTVNTLNKDIRTKYGENTPPIKINPESAERLVNAKTEDGVEEAYQQVLQDVADQTPTTWLDKWNAWRYFAMLSNPKTHIRNIVGNGIFLPVVRIRYFMAAGIETVDPKVDKSQRTKSIVIKKEYREFAKKDCKSKDAIALLTDSKKYDDRNQLQQKKKIFKHEALNFVTSLNGNLLEAEDLLFKNMHYRHALAGFLQARGIDLNNVSEDVLMEARTYAVKEAKKATFNDDSAIASRIQKFSSVKYDTVEQNGVTKKYINGGSVLLNIGVESVLPFKRTPINIVKRGLEYSPLGLTATLTKGIYDVKRGKITATEFIDGLASGLTGTGIMAIGMLLASLGYARGGDDDEEKSRFEKLLGKQEYSIEFFGKSYTVDFAAPACIPFFIGVEIIEIKNGTEDFSLSKLGNVTWNTLEPITNLSMLSGMQSVIEATRYADNSQILASIAGDSALTYATQGIPSVFGGIARTIDSKQRTWYKDKGSKITDAFTQSAINSVKSKIPGLSYTQAPKIDEWGREVSRGNIVERIAENFFSPGYYSSEKMDNLSSELIRLYDATKEKVFPKKAGSSISVSGETVYLNQNQYTKYAKSKGKYSFDYISELLERKAYKRLTDEEKADVITNLYKYANAKAKHDVISEYDLMKMKQFKSVTKYEKNGGSAIDYYIDNAISK